MNPVELLGLVVGIVGKAVDLAQKIQASKALDHAQAKAALEAADAALSTAIAALAPALAADDATVDTELASRGANKL
jgi:hypothetical protein